MVSRLGKGWEGGVLAWADVHASTRAPPTASPPAWRSLADASKCQSCEQAYRVDSKGVCEACKVPNW